MKWKASSGNQNQFLDDCLLGHASLSNSPFFNYFKEDNITRFWPYVKDNVYDGCWKNLTEISGEPGSLQCSLNLINLSLDPSIEDALIWTTSSFGNFSMFSTFRIFYSMYHLPPFWARVWNSKLIPKINISFWILLWEINITLDNLCKRGLSIANKCFLCYDNYDSTIHFILDYPFVRMWSHFFSLWNISWVFPSYLVDIWV